MADRVALGEVTDTELASELLARMRVDEDSDWWRRLLAALEGMPLVDEARVPHKRNWVVGREPSEAEVRVLQAASVGLTAQMTADVYGIPLETVNTQRRAVLYKLGAKNVTQAVALAFRSGLIT